MFAAAGFPVLLWPTSKGRGSSVGEISKSDETAVVADAFYKQVASILDAARDKAYTTINFVMVEAYWEIGRSIVEEQGGEERAAYGESLIEGLAARLTNDFGRASTSETSILCANSTLPFQFGTHCVPN